MPNTASVDKYHARIRWNALWVALMCLGESDQVFHLSGQLYPSEAAEYMEIWLTPNADERLAFSLGEQQTIRKLLTALDTWIRRDHPDGLAWDDFGVLRSSEFTSEATACASEVVKEIMNAGLPPYPFEEELNPTQRQDPTREKR
jgi:hypothetical protein